MKLIIRFFRRLVLEILLLLRSSPLRRPIIKLLVNLHNFSYHLISLFSSYRGHHPKHEIMHYYQFFLDQIKSTDIVLDVGSGSGYVASQLATKAKRVIGIDIREQNVKRAQHNYRRNNLLFLQGDATKHNFHDPVDVIILSNVLEHILERVAFLKKMHDIAPVILIRVPLLTRDWLTVYKKKEGFEYRLDETHYTEYTDQSFRQEMAEANLEIESYDKNFGEIYAVCRRKL